MTERADAVASRRRRPKNRKAQIASVAAAAFSERGYHAVGIDDIAAEVGVSGPALYRHFPNKYALFVDAAMGLADALHESVTTVREDPDAAVQLEQVLAGVITTTIDNRRTGGLYRWENRYLRPEDQSRLRTRIESINHAIAEPLTRLRPELNSYDAATLAAAALSVIGSITAHRAVLPSKRIESLLLAAATAVLHTELPKLKGRVSESVTDPNRGMLTASKRELLLAESLHLFYRYGYHEVSIEEIAVAAGMNASGVYRHFSGKSDLLATNFRRAGDRLALAVGSALERANTPHEALTGLVEVYVDLSFRHHELISVYYAEILNLPADERTTLRNVQRINIDEWAQLLRDTRPDLAVAEARFLVHAALGLVLDVGGLLRFDSDSGAPARVKTLMLTTLSDSQLA
ncbi:TetR/AcrR family transcriptional regulator [Rhodococcus sp. NPDC058521]|uniref:TetR/AcrR family transcriptional regulator n=1 Tax=Rhodococcus sp. NPDC058521 TaxID=3346536 RepID=UPI00365D66B9